MQLEGILDDQPTIPQARAQVRGAIGRTTESVRPSCTVAKPTSNRPASGMIQELDLVALNVDAIRAVEGRLFGSRYAAL